MPLLGFLIIGLKYKTLNTKVTGWIASGSVFISFLFSLFVFSQILQSKTPLEINLFNWISFGNVHIPFSFYIDQLSSVMLLVVTGVGFLIHVYSIGYMHGDAGYNRFFAYMNLFVFSMLLLVMGANYLVMFIGWEGVGLCSYLLIGFWFKNNEYNNAAKKAFIMNRIGDLGFLLGMFLIIQTFGSLSFTEIFPKATLLTSGNNTIVIITLLLFVGAIGKSAQIPLYTWLPDAMAGPTPVSALIHAATMVTAGVYMVARSNILYALAPVSLAIIAIIGVSTALFAATIAIYQNDIKKVLAYSTVSQLGYMFLALGVGAFSGAIFHLVTHAFFKALLFLGAGSVIHALKGEQDIRKMGGLKSGLQKTFLVFLIATFAISGLPPFSGFFSKDEILAHAFDANKLLWILGFLGALMTAFYMFRLLYLTFYGKFRGTEEQKNHLHESPNIMMIPLIILAVLSLFGGFIGVPEFLGGGNSINAFLSPVFEHSLKLMQSEKPLGTSTEWIITIVTSLSVILSITFAWFRFVKKENVPAENATGLNPLENTLLHKYYIDEIYETIIENPVMWMSKIFHEIIDIKGIDKLVNQLGKFVMFTGDKARLLQAGTIGFYLIAMVFSIIGILWYFIL